MHLTSPFLLLEVSVEVSVSVLPTLCSPLPSPGAFPDPGIEPCLALKTDSFPLSHQGSPFSFSVARKRNWYILISGILELMKYGLLISESSLTFPIFQIMLLHWMSHNIQNTSVVAGQSSPSLPHQLWSWQLAHSSGHDRKLKLLFFYQQLQSLSSGFPGGSVVKNLLLMQETGVRSLCWEDPLEKEMATHSSILAWGIPRMEELGGLQSMGSQKCQTRVSSGAHTQPQLRCLDTTHFTNKRNTASREKVNWKTDCRKINLEKKWVAEMSLLWPEPQSCRFSTWSGSPLLKIVNL